MERSRPWLQLRLEDGGLDIVLWSTSKMMVVVPCKSYQIVQTVISKQLQSFNSLHPVRNLTDKKGMSKCPSFIQKPDRHLLQMQWSIGLLLQLTDVTF